MPTLAHTKIIAISDLKSIKNYIRDIEINDSLLVLNKLIPEPEHFTIEYWNKSKQHENEISTWRYRNWGTNCLPLVQSEIIENFPEMYALHILEIATKYCPPYPILDFLMNKNDNLDFIIGIDFESGASVLEYKKKSDDASSQIFQIEDTTDENFYNNLTPDYLNNFQSIETTVPLGRALSHTSCGKIFMDLKYPNGIPFSLNHY